MINYFNVQLYGTNNRGKAVGHICILYIKCIRMTYILYLDVALISSLVESPSIHKQDSQ